jgi:hypothetical protein
MRSRQITAAAIIVMLLFFPGCKTKEKFLVPYYMLKKWSRAIKDFNYKDYSECEANPKSFPVFREMYQEYYLTDINITRIEDFDEDNVRKDPEGNSYQYRLVEFECMEVKRKTERPVNHITGDLLFIKYSEGGRQKDGWLMSNRTLIRTER